MSGKLNSKLLVLKNAQPLAIGNDNNLVSEYRDVLQTKMLSFFSCTHVLLMANILYSEQALFPNLDEQWHHDSAILLLLTLCYA